MAKQVTPLVSPFYIALFSDWARPAAKSTSESKFSEAGLGAVMVTDYRNFAHGRHNWIDKKGADSTVIASLYTGIRSFGQENPPTTANHNSGFRVYNRNIRTLGRPRTHPSGFRFTALVGDHYSIDPGRPGIPSYGSRLYRLGPVIYKRSRGNDLKGSAVNRKQSARGTIGREKRVAHVSLAFDTYISQHRTHNSARWSLISMGPL